MSYPDPNHGRSHTHQSIPLQDLNRPPDEFEQDAPQEHRRTLSDRGRNLLRQTGAIATGGHFRDSQYSPIAEVSPSPTRFAQRPQINTNLPPANNGIRRVVEDEEPGSPLDAGAFQAAIGFGMGMEFQGTTSPPMPTTGSSQLSYVDTPYEHEPYVDRSTSEDHDYFSPTYDDTARLTDSRNLQPISGATAPTTPIEQDRSSFQSVRFLSPGDASPIGRHGDDIGQVEAGATCETREEGSAPCRLAISSRRYTGLGLSCGICPSVLSMSAMILKLPNEPFSGNPLNIRDALHHLICQFQPCPSIPQMALPHLFHPHQSRSPRRLSFTQEHQVHHGNILQILCGERVWEFSLPTIN